MSNKYKILELLKGNKLTIKDLNEKIKFKKDSKENMNFIRTYIHRLKKENLIREINKDGSYIIYTAIEKGLNGEGLLDGNSNSVMKDFKRLYQIMNVFLLPKINENKIAEIPNSVLEELENLEEGYNFE